MQVFSQIHKNRLSKLTLLACLFLFMMFGMAKNSYALNEFYNDCIGIENCKPVYAIDNSNLSGTTMYIKFTATTTSNFNNISIRLGRNGTPVQTVITPEIHTGSIGGTLISTCSSVLVSSINDTVFGVSEMDLIDFTCGGETMASGTTYYIKLFDVTRWSHVNTNTLFLGNSGIYPITQIGFYNIGTYLYGNGLIINSSNIIPPNYLTHIISLTPANNSTTTNPVNIDFQFYISPDDVANGDMVDIFANNRGRNSISEMIGYTNQIIIASFLATTSGIYNFSTTTTLAKGNYQLQAQLSPCSNFLGITCLQNPLQFIGIYHPSGMFQSNNFIVGSATSGWNGTTLGNISANVNNEINSVLNGGTYSSSTQASLDKCNPLGGSFDIGSCLWVISVPNTDDLKTALDTSIQIIFNSFPLGYLNRIKTILSSNATSSLPSITINTQYPNSPFASSTNLVIDTNDILMGADNLATTIRDPIHGENLKDIMYNIVILQVVLEVVIYIFVDLTKYRNRRK